MEGFAYSAGVSEIEWDPIGPSIEISPELVYVSQGGTAHIVYSSSNATRVTVDGVDSASVGIVSRTYTALGTTVIRITAFGVTGTTPATATARVVCINDTVETPPVVNMDVSIQCGPDKDAVDGVAKVPYWTRNAESVSASLYKDGELVSTDSVPVAERGVRYIEFEVTTGEYVLVFTATGINGSTDTDSFSVTAMTDFSLDFVLPENLSTIGDSKEFDIALLLSCNLDVATLDPVVFTQTAGSGSLTFAEGRSVAVDENYVIEASGVKYALAGGDSSDSVEITASITISGVEYTDSITLGVISDYLDVTITPSVYPSIVVLEQLIWDVNAVIRAYNFAGVDTSFADIVDIYGYATPEGLWQGRTDLTGEITSYCPGDTYDIDIAVPVSGDVSIPAEAFVDGACVVSVQIEAPLYDQDLTAPYDPNSSWASLRIQASVNNGTQMALGLGGADLLGTDTLVLGLPDAIVNGTTTAVTLSAIDAQGRSIPASKYSIATVEYTAVDSTGAEVQLSLDGVTYTSAVQDTFGSTNLYYDLTAAVSPITTFAVVQDLVDGYYPYTSTTRDVDFGDIYYGPPDASSGTLLDGNIITWFGNEGDYIEWTVVGAGTGIMLSTSRSAPAIGVPVGGYQASVYVNTVYSGKIYHNNATGWENFGLSERFDVVVPAGAKVRIQIVAADAANNYGGPGEAEPWFGNVEFLSIV